MSIYHFTTREFFTEISKILPDWDIEITPKDYIDSPDKYRKSEITIIAKHKQHSLIVKQQSMITGDLKDVYGDRAYFGGAWHYAGIYNMISHAIFDNIIEDKKERDKLFDNISSHFSQIFSARKISLEND